MRIDVNAALQPLLSADTAADLVSGLATVAPASTPFVVDHAQRALLSLIGEESVALGGPVADALLAGRPAVDGPDRWTPLLERREPVVVLRSSADAPEPDPIVGELVGAIMNVQRTRLEKIEARRRRKGLSVAAELQWDLLPLRADVTSQFAIGCGLEPAYEVAGDLFDYSIDDEGLWVYSFDGMGHGLEATMAASVVFAAVRNARRSGEDLDGQMCAASEVLLDTWRGDRFVTGVACRIEQSGVRYVNAGHEPVRRFDGATVVLEDLAADVPLGVEPDTSYEVQHREPLGPGDGIVILSDGFGGSTDPRGNELGADAIVPLIADAWDPTPLVTVHRLLGHVADRIGDGHLGDDVTAVIVSAVAPTGGRST